jgi:hypothetical protein
MEKLEIEDHLEHSVGPFYIGDHRESPESEHHVSYYAPNADDVPESWRFALRM